MFGFLKPKLAPQGPVEFRFEVVIERPAEEVYALVDWADPRNAERVLGGEITRVGGAADLFRAVLDHLPEYVFEISVVEATPHVAYGFVSETVPPMGRLVRAHERYSFAPLAPGRCVVELVNTVTFVDGLRMKELDEEIAMVTTACRSALAKLRIHAEHGAEAARAVRDQVLD